MWARSQPKAAGVLGEGGAGVCNVLELQWEAKRGWGLGVGETNPVPGYREYQIQALGFKVQGLNQKKDQDRKDIDARYWPLFALWKVCFVDESTRPMSPSPVCGGSRPPLL